jgi:hypothetical protein
MKVQGGHRHSVKPQNHSQAHQVIGLGCDLSRLKGAQLVRGDFRCIRCGLKRELSSVSEFLEDISGLIFKVHVEHC